MAGVDWEVQGLAEVYYIGTNYNLMRVLGVSLENDFSPVGHSWHLLP